MGIHLDRGLALFELRRYEEAVNEFSRELSEEPNSAMALANRASALINLGRIRAAENDAREAISVEPEYAFAYYLVSLCRLNRRHITAAEKAICEALRIAPNPIYFEQLGRIQFHANLFAKCLDATKQALEFDPHYVPALILRAKALVRIGNLSDAEKLLRQALAVHAENPETHSELGSLILQAGAARPALDHLLQARRIDPVKFNDRVSLAGAYGRLLWPFNRIDALIGWLRCRAVLQRWAAVALFASLVNFMYLVVRPRDSQFSILPLAIWLLTVNAVVFLGTFELFARLAAMARLRRELDLHWNHWLGSSEYVLGIIVAHSASSLFAVGISIFPALAFAGLALLLLSWDTFYLVGQLPIPIAFFVGPLVGVGALILTVAGAISVPDQSRTVLQFWVGILSISLMAALLRTMIDKTSRSSITQEAE